jgi:cell division topological specificity factor
MNVMDALFRKGRTSSRETAKERLRFILINDRARIPPQMLNMIKDELIQVLSKHLEIDVANIDITISRGNDRNKLIADITILGLRKRN